MDEVDEPHEKDYETVAWLINYRHAPSEERAEMRTAFVREFLSRGDASQTDKGAFNQHFHDFFREGLQSRSVLHSAWLIMHARFGCWTATTVLAEDDMGPVVLHHRGRPDRPTGSRSEVTAMSLLVQKENYALGAACH